MNLVLIARYLADMCHVKNERGASLVEYAFLVGLIAMVCLAALVFFGQATSSRYSNVASSVGGAGG
jgi:pilus assembly protein Flp/PilA